MRSKTRSGAKKLSEVARHLIMPSGIVSTAWPSVASQLERMELPLDRWQQGLCQAILAKREDGQYACGVGGAVASIPRQSGKTYTIGALIFALCMASPGLLVLWSAHRTRTHNETFKTMDSMANRKAIAPFIENVRKANGEQEVEFTNGSRILFGAREAGFGRGFAMVDVVVLDEAQILTEKAMEDMVPATNAADNGLVIMVGTPPRPIDPGEVFINRRAEALSGEDEDVLFVELSADEDADLDDRKQWAKANPSFPHRTSETAILRMRKLLGSDDSFRREALGIWDSTQGSHAFGRGMWEAVEKVGRPRGLELGALGVAVSIDLEKAAIVGAAETEDEKNLVRPLQHGPNPDAWLVDAVVERQEKHQVPVIIDGKGPAADFIEPLKDRLGDSLIVVVLQDVMDACSKIYKSVRSGDFVHSVDGEHDELDIAVRDAVKRDVGDRWAWGRRKSGLDISPLEAATLAVWGLSSEKAKPFTSAYAETDLIII